MKHLLYQRLLYRQTSIENFALIALEIIAFHHYNLKKFADSV
ncbi:hypothetical protein MNBD_ALPHA11-747 [hydrothermal vent metagenome]|uniref:Uncharacterized protein n=1 Tax=hydrothermal vent metagenome TaxID=652676 RepID=A0A3B0UN38_9ZZZZ